ncbi:MAG: methyltransferase domain-containing protein [Deltaproteobacteria bacterium]|nr:methyltransferase domain-containing protein [Deltaproteobacteria bacterium]
MADAPQSWFFDAWSRVYDFAPVQAATYKPVHDAILAALRGVDCHRVLDIGCGTGRLAARLSRELPQTQIVGCDFSAGMLSQAHAHQTRASWVRGDATRLPLRSAAVDVVVSSEAFHWFPDQPAALAELFRVLQPGGLLLLALVNTPSALLSNVMHAGSRLAGQPFYWPTVGEMRQRVEAAGFRVRRQQRIFRLPGFLLPPVLTHAVRPVARKSSSVRRQA